MGLRGREPERRARAARAADGERERAEHETHLFLRESKILTPKSNNFTRTLLGTKFYSSTTDSAPRRWSACFRLTRSGRGCTLLQSRTSRKPSAARLFEFWSQQRERARAQSACGAPASMIGARRFGDSARFFSAPAAAHG